MDVQNGQGLALARVREPYHDQTDVHALPLGAQIGTDQLVPFGVQVGMARIVFPDGGELEKNGVTPDVSCLPSGKEMREERDVCLWKAVAMAREKLGLPPDASVMEGKPTDVTH